MELVPPLIQSSELGARDQRALTLLLLYSIDMQEYQISMQSILSGYYHGFDTAIDLDSYIVKNITDIIDKKECIDQEIIPLLNNWRIDRLSVITRLILRYSMWELMTQKTPHTIIINEAVELAKAFAENDSYKFINGILDEWMKKYKDKERPLCS